MLRMNRTYFVSTCLVTFGALAFVAACGSSDSGSAGSGGGGPAPGDTTCTDCAVPPVTPEAGVPGDGPGTTLAINKLFLGDTTRDGTPDQNAWKSYGYDLDGYKSTVKSKVHCKYNEGGEKSAVQTDGNDGIDNSFGQNIMPVIVGLASDAASQINETIAEGSFTIILEVGGVGTGKDYVNLPAALYAGANLGSAPAFDGTDEWPVFCELMTDCKTADTMQYPDNKSKVQFTSSYIAGGTWVSGSKSTVSLSLSLQGFALSLNIREAVISADMASGSPAPTAASNGVIAGILETDELIASLAKVAGSISTSLCSGPTFDSVAQQIKAASDIMKDGTQDAAQNCNGISVGLGFDMKAVKVGPVLDQAPPGTDPCENP